MFIMDKARCVRTLFFFFCGQITQFVTIHKLGCSSNSELLIDKNHNVVELTALGFVCV